MITKNIGILVALVGLLMMVGQANAGTIAVTFDFTAPNPGSGTILYNAASVNSDIESLISIDLSIAGHDYQLSEVGFFTSATIRGVGGLLFGPAAIAGGEGPDFMLTWNSATNELLTFVYTVPDAQLIYPAGGKNFVVTAVPEPSSIILFSIGLGAISFVGWRFRS